MLWNYVKVVFRNLIRNRMYSAIIVLGLALGMAVFTMIAMWVRDETGYDSFHRDSEEIYQILSYGTKYFTAGFDGTPGPIAAAAAEEIPEVTGHVKLGMVPKLAFRYGDRVFNEDSGLLVDDTFLDLFSFELLKGDRESVFEAPFSFVLTESMAKRYFGDEDPVGETMSSEGFEGKVTGVLLDPPSNSTIRFDYLVSFETYRRLGGSDSYWSAYNYLSFLRLSEDADIESVAARITAIGERNGSAQITESGCWFELQPMTRMHLADTSYERSFLELGDGRLVVAFTIASLLVLVLACINFMNLSTARAGRRAREIGLRKVVGAGRTGIIKQFFGESLVYSAMAMAVAAIIIEFSMPWFNSVSGKSLDVDWTSPPVIILFLSTMLFTALTAGSYPAFFLSAFRPAVVLKGTVTQGSRSVLFRKILVVGQFSLTIMLMITAAFLSGQMRFMSESSLGFSKEDLIHITFNEEIAAKYDYMKEALLEDPSVTAVSAQSSLIPEITFRNTDYSWDGKDPEVSRDMIFSMVDYDYFETMGMEIAAGRTFSRKYGVDADGSFIVNEEAARSMGVEDPVGLGFSKGDRHGTIVGVVRDANLRSMHIEIEPHVFFIVADKNMISSYGNVLVRIDGERTQRALGHIESVWKEICPDKPFEFSFMDETYDRLYSAERRAGTIINSFSLFALVISCLGLLGLASFMAELKTREIAVRKVLGATVPGIVYLLTREFSRSVLLANLIAWPAAYLVVRRMLRIYAYRIEITPWTFIWASALALLVAVATVSLQAMRAALTDPARTIRYE